MQNPYNLFMVMGFNLETSFETDCLALWPSPAMYSLWDKGDQANFHMHGPYRVQLEGESMRKAQLKQVTKAL